MCMNTLLQAALEAAQQLGTAAEQWATADASSVAAQQAARDAAQAADDAKLIKAEALSRAHAALDALAGVSSTPSGSDGGSVAQAAILGGDRNGPFKRLMDRRRKEIADGLVAQGVPREVAVETARQLGDGTILRLILEYGPAFIQAIIKLFGSSGL